MSFGGKADVDRNCSRHKVCQTLLRPTFLTALLIQAARTKRGPLWVSKQFKSPLNFGGRTRTRTLDPLINSQRNSIDLAKIFPNRQLNALLQINRLR
jgi:hypothetical protein